MRPLLGITMGDVAGIGPEIIAKSLAHTDVYDRCRPLVVGDERALRRAIDVCGLPLAVRRVDTPANAAFEPGTADLLQAGEPLEDVAAGEVSEVAGAGAVAFIKAAARLGRDGEIDGIVTAPLNKAAMHRAGHRYPGHTELLAELFDVERFSLVLSAEHLFLFHITTHVALREACDLLTVDRALRTIALAHGFASALGHGDEPVAVAGLNPHAGEGGLFGHEDDDVLVPAVEQARATGMNVVGPLPADAVVPQAVGGRYRFVVVCYHDQGHVPFKSVYGERGVNITVGLPVVRVSVDHGTAFDIAGKGIAREDGLLEALNHATRLAPSWDDIYALISADDEQGGGGP